MTSLQVAYVRRVAEQNPLVAAWLMALIDWRCTPISGLPICNEHGVSYAVLLGVAWDTWAELSRLPQV